VKPGINAVVIGGIAILAFGIGIWFGVKRDDANQSKVIVQDSVITVLPKPKSLKEFSLQDANGNPFTTASLASRYSILFFGYTSCPDICPTTMQVLGQLYKNLEHAVKSNQYQVVFVSVDPGRDDANKLKKYVEYFNKAFVGVSGRPDQIAALAGQLGAAYEVHDGNKKSDYGIDHTGLLFVTNPNAEFAAILSPPHDADRIRSRLDLLRQIEKR